MSLEVTAASLEEVLLDDVLRNDPNEAIVDVSRLLTAAF